MMTKPFEVKVPQSVLDDLRRRLSETRWPDEIITSGWEYGVNLSYMKEICRYWMSEFDWRKTETEVNSYPNFLMEIDGHSIHFLHIKGKGKSKLPLLLTHGWPGSFLEFMKVIPLLTEDENFSFDLVIPSVVGFGFSKAVTKPGCDNAYIANIWYRLMQQLGYEKYGVHGGDIGSGISTRLALKYPQHVTGLHLNYVSDSYRPYKKEPGKPIAGEEDYFKGLEEWASKEAAYTYLQATKPITLAYGLNDSPAGLCAWILEKMYSWSDHNGEHEEAISKDEILANVTLYWITQSIHSSVRIYNENSQNPMVFGVNDFVKVPVAYANFPKEISRPPKPYLTKGYNLKRWTDMESGGHFAALERPELLAKDLKDFFSSL